MYSPIGSEQRANFISKVYFILFLQLLVTAVICALVYTNERLEEIVTSLYLVIFIATIAVLVVLMCCVQESFPLNFILFWVFTVLMSLMVSVITSQYSLDTLLPCLGITVITVGGISAFCYVTKKDFSFLGPYLFGGLMLLILLPIVFYFFPPSGPVQMFYYAAGVVIFVGYLFYDTSNLVNGKYQNTIGGDFAYILAAIDLYLDIINLFIYILALFSGGSGDRQRSRSNRR